MNDDHASALKTIGVGTFGEGPGGKTTERLFRVEPGHSVEFVLEQAALLMGCVSKLTHHVMIEDSEAMTCAAHFLSGMAKALVEDLATANESPGLVETSSP
ncbi:DUF3077 domain-containing protein [Pseudomonas sp. B21-035]|uniref:DUF3077 domain-containing protein n=1 Tax=Pseudomonas sp. B21-035 TaxID=2895484 RepID=UPI00215DFB30|nr:DUF3077 domain-containing protein [Pseudomonas sp. B21-035]UVL55584.1 DUF3077 domain-containing protein [Pseudomonas sp. B21-035]